VGYFEGIMLLVRTASAVLVLLALASAAHADVVTLRNGDRLTGTFVSVRNRALSFRTDALGTVAIPVAQISSVSLDDVVMIASATRGGMARRGWLTIDPDGEWHLIDPDDGAMHDVGPEITEVILPVDGYQSIVEHEAGPWQDWSGTANLGYSVQRGNQQTNTFSSSVDAIRERPAAPLFRQHWRTNLHVITLLSNAVEADTSIGANTASGSVRQDRLLAPGNFVFGIAQFDHVGTEGLSLRQTFGGGAGYDIGFVPRGTLSMFGGLTLVRERFASGEQEQSAQLLIGEKLRLQVTPRLRIDHAANGYPHLTTLGQFHVDTRTSLDVKLTNRFSLNTSLIDLYLSTPSAGSRRNNFSLTTGITTTFGPGLQARPAPPSINP
jgi:putative salt-induced outer membrane protein YdiY